MRKNTKSTTGTSKTADHNRPPAPPRKRSGRGPAYDHDPGGLRAMKDKAGPAPWVKRGK